MSEGVLLGLIATGGVVASAALGSVGVVLGLLWRRIGELEDRIAKLADRESRIRWWALELRDLYYRYRRPDAPDLPPIPELEDTP